MRIRITESQYRILVNKPRDVVFGNVNEGGGSKPKETPEEIDAKIEEILNYIRNGDVFITADYSWLRNKLRDDKTEEKKFQNVFNQIKKIQKELENKKIKEILNHVRNGGEFIRNVTKNDYYKWLFNKSLSDKTEEQKFQKALDQIKEIQNELEDKEIERIKNHVRNGDAFTIADYNWLYNKTLTDKTEEQKFKKAFDQINEIRKKLDNKKIKDILNYVRNGGSFIRNDKNDKYLWLRNKLRIDKTEEQKFQKALDQIYKIQAKLGIKREWWGEKTIIDTLTGLGFKNIPQQGQHKYKDCRNSLTCKFYKFDIYLPYNKNNYMVGKNKDFYIPETGIIFEYDGLQHFNFI